MADHDISGRTHVYIHLLLCRLPGLRFHSRCSGILVHIGPEWWVWICTKHDFALLHDQWNLSSPVAIVGIPTLAASHWDCQRPALVRCMVACLHHDYATWKLPPQERMDSCFLGHFNTISSRRLWRLYGIQ